MMATFADDVHALGEHHVVRQKGGLSSFHIPAETIGHVIWRKRYGKNEQSEAHCRCQREEKIALQRHALEAGCKLIINPGLLYQQYGPEAWRSADPQSLSTFSGRWMTSGVGWPSIWEWIPGSVSPS